MNAKAFHYLSLARKARLIEAGEEPVGAVCRAQKARLVLLAGDASPHTYRRAKSFVAGTKQPLIQLDCTKDDLGTAIGYSACAILAITDVRLALAFVMALDDPKHAELLADLEVRAARADQRQKEEKAHRNNIRRGKKKK